MYHLLNYYRSIDISQFPSVRHAIILTKPAITCARVTGLTVHLMHLPGETDDHIGIWIPSLSAFMCGDNLYKSFPNLYAIRGTGHRDLTQWITSLDAIRKLKPTYLLMSHSRPLIGQDSIMATLTSYRDAIQLVHDQSIRLANRGYHRNEIGRMITVPDHLRSHPYLQEFYGTLEWSAKSVYEG